MSIFRYRLARVFFSFSIFLRRSQTKHNINKVPLKKVLFLECIKLNGLSFNQKLLNATSKNYFSAIYFTNTSLQLTLTNFSFIFNIIFQFTFFFHLIFFYYFEPVHIIFLRRVHLILLSIFEETLLSFYHLYI